MLSERIDIDSQPFLTESNLGKLLLGIPIADLWHPGSRFETLPSGSGFINDTALSLTVPARSLIAWPRPRRFVSFAWFTRRSGMLETALPSREGTGREGKMALYGS
jgi:hypothetical protein